MILVVRLACESPRVDEAPSYPPDPDFLRAEQTLGFGWRHFVRTAVGGLYVWRVNPEIGEDGRAMALAKVEGDDDPMGEGLDDVAMRGLALAAMDQPEEALAVFDRAAVRWPNCVEVRLMRAIGLMRLGRWPEADGELSAASRRAPAMPETRMLQGVVCCYRGRANYGLSMFEQVVAMRPDWAPGWMGLASALTWCQRSMGRALEAAKKARELAPDDPDAWTGLSWTYRRWEQYPEAERSAREAVARFGDHALPHRELGSALAAQERFDDAELAYAAALKISPDSPETLLSRAWMLGTLQERWKESAEVCRALVRAWPRFGWGWRKLGHTCDQLEDWNGSAEAYREALRVESWENMRAEMQQDLAAALVRLGRHAEAEVAYRDWLRLEPARLAAWHGLARALGEQGEWEEAEFAAKRVLRLSLANPSAQLERYRAWCTIGWLDEGQRRWPEAAAAYVQATRLDSERPDAWNAWLEMLLRNESWRRAIPVARRQTKHMPDDHDAWCHLARALVGSDDSGTDAEAAARRAIELDGECPDARRALGVALRQQGREAEARAALREARKAKAPKEEPGVEPDAR